MEKIGAIFMDLSRTINTINHRLLLTKLKEYGLQRTTLKQVENYLTVLLSLLFSKDKNQ